MNIISPEEAKNWESQQRKKAKESGNYRLELDRDPNNPDDYAHLGGRDAFQQRLKDVEWLNTPGGKLGEIYRGEWNNWVDQFLPVDRKLMDLAGKQTDNRLAESNAKYGTQFAFNRAREADEMSRRGLGTSLSSEESQYLNRNSSLAEAAATAKNINQTRLHTADRDKAIMSGGLTGGLRDLTNKTG
jgi:hypothetical protein